MYRKSMLVLFSVCLLAIMAFAGFWKLTADAIKRSEVGRYGSRYVPEGVDSHDYAIQQSALADRYAWTAFGVMIIGIISLSSSVTLAIVIRNEKRRRKQTTS